MIRGCWEEVPAGAEVVRDGAERDEELLRVRRRREALEHPFSSADRPMGILCSIIQSFVPPMLRSWEDLPQGGRIAGQFVRDHLWDG